MRNVEWICIFVQYRFHLYGWNKHIEKGSSPSITPFNHILQAVYWISHTTNIELNSHRRCKSLSKYFSTCMNAFTIENPTYRTEMAKLISQKWKYSTNACVQLKAQTKFLVGFWLYMNRFYSRRSTCRKWKQVIHGIVRIYEQRYVCDFITEKHLGSHTIFIHIDFGSRMECNNIVLDMCEWAMGTQKIGKQLEEGRIGKTKKEVIKTKNMRDSHEVMIFLRCVTPFTCCCYTCFYCDMFS